MKNEEYSKNHPQTSVHLEKFTIFLWISEPHPDFTDSFYKSVYSILILEVSIN